MKTLFLSWPQRAALFGLVLPLAGLLTGCGGGTSPSVPQSPSQPSSNPTRPFAALPGTYRGIYNITAGPAFEQDPEPTWIDFEVSSSGRVLISLIEGNNSETFTAQLSSDDTLNTSFRRTGGNRETVSLQMSFANIPFTVRYTGTFSTSSGNRGVISATNETVISSSTLAAYAGRYAGTFTYNNGPEAGQSFPYGFTVSLSGLVTVPTDNDFVTGQLRSDGRVEIFETDTIGNNTFTITSTLDLVPGGAGTVSTGTFTESDGTNGTLRMVKQP